MERNFIIEKKLSDTTLTVQVTQVGDDFNIILQGGDKPHIGCTVIAIPRPSLENNGEMSATSSVLNVTGHKDEQLCRYLAEAVASSQNAVTVCSGGFHMDNITKEQIKEVMEVVKEIALCIQKNPRKF